MESFENGLESFNGRDRQNQIQKNPTCFPSSLHLHLLPLSFSVACSDSVREREHSPPPAMCGILAVFGCTDNSQAKRSRIIELSRRSFLFSVFEQIYLICFGCGWFWSDSKCAWFRCFISMIYIVWVVISFVGWEWGWMNESKLVDHAISVASRAIFPIPTISITACDL